MTLAEKREEYRLFFESNKAGIAFITELERMIADDHKQAESNPESARDCSQSAKGVRRVLDHIKSITTEVKKGRVAKS